MKSKIFVFIENEPLLKSIIKSVGNEAQIIVSSIKNIFDNIIEGDPGSFQFMLAECDYNCVLDKCAAKFILFRRSHSVPFGILRVSVIERAVPRMYYLCVFSDSNLSADQKILIEKIRNSELSVVNPYRFIHPTNPIRKFIDVEKEIVGNPSRLLKVSKLAHSANLSEPWLSYHFKKIGKLGLDSLIHKNVFCHALWQLISTEMPIKSIAIEHGYKPHSFTSRFVGVFGVPPNNVRTRIFGMK